MNNINRENFKRAIAFLETNKEHIQANLAMNTLGSWIPDKLGNVCNSPACIIGHVVSGQSMEDLEEHVYTDRDDNILFVGYCKWSYDFFFSSSIDDNPSEDVENMWHFLFFDSWPNDIEQAILRMKYVLNNESVPKGWYYADEDEDGYEGGDLYLYIVEE